MKPTTYSNASKLISTLGLIVFAIGLILNKNIYLIVWGILMILLGTFWYFKSLSSRRGK